MSANLTPEEAQVVYENALLLEVKRYLDITWDDIETDAKLLGQLRRGIAYISAKTGVSASAFAGDLVDYRAQELLFNYVLYDRAGAVDQYKRQYLSDIIGLKIRWEVARANATESEG